MTGIGVIGYGYWGPQLARNFAALPNTRLLAVCDGDFDRRSLAGQRHPGIATMATCDELLRVAGLDAVVIATPAASHAELAHSCLTAGKHVLIEKPLGASSAEACALAADAARRELALLVDHTYLYSSAVESIAALIDAGELGSVYYYDSVRTNLGRFRSDVDVLWDLASHDLAIVDYLFDDAPTSLQAAGFRRTPDANCELAYLTLRWGERRIAHFHVSWITQVKVRRTLIGGSRAMIVYDDLDPDAKVRIYEQASGGDADHAADSVDATQLRVGYRSGAMRAPLLTVAEPLYRLASHFIDCIVHKCPPRSGARSGVQVVRWLEAADRSLAHGGALIELDEQPRADEASNRIRVRI